MRRATRTPTQRRLVKPRRPDPRTDAVVAVIATLVALVVLPLLGVTFVGSLVTFAVAALLMVACGFVPFRFAAPTWLVLLLGGALVLSTVETQGLVFLSGACGVAAGSGPMSWLFWNRWQAG